MLSGTDEFIILALIFVIIVLPALLLFAAVVWSPFFLKKWASKRSHDRSAEEFRKIAEQESDDPWT